MQLQTNIPPCSVKISQSLFGLPSKDYAPLGSIENNFKIETASVMLLRLIGTSAKIVKKQKQLRKQKNTMIYMVRHDGEEKRNSLYAIRITTLNL